MNVEQIYRLHRDEAFAKQFTAPEYTTFVAMPFGKTDEYDADAVYRLLREQVHLRANQLRAEAKLPKSFAQLQRVSEHKGTAIVVTESIAIHILEDHFLVGDLTGNNTGVVLETGVALGLKPNRRLVLITQDDHQELHFDVSVTHVTRYTSDAVVENVAHALVEAAKVFEFEARLYITQVSARLTSDAIMVLNIYGQLWKSWKEGSPNPSIFQRAAGFHKDHFAGAIGRTLFEPAARELIAHRLLWTDYQSNAVQGGDLFGHHATELGWLVIEHIWKHDSEMRKPAGAPTGPNLT
jgi:hypothetical protein